MDHLLFHEYILYCAAACFLCGICNPSKPEIIFKTIYSYTGFLTIFTFLHPSDDFLGGPKLFNCSVKSSHKFFVLALYCGALNIPFASPTFVFMKSTNLPNCSNVVISFLFLKKMYIKNSNW